MLFLVCGLLLFLLDGISFRAEMTVKITAEDFTLLKQDRRTDLVVLSLSRKLVTKLKKASS